LDPFLVAFMVLLNLKTSNKLSKMASAEKDLNQIKFSFRKTVNVQKIQRQFCLALSIASVKRNVELFCRFGFLICALKRNSHAPSNGLFNVDMFNFIAD